MGADVLTARALNRATLERQLLLRRSAMAPLDAVAHLVGMQAQEPPDPYTGLWSRLDGFRPEELSQLLLDRRVVRTVVMRGTIHLVTADDCLVLRPLVQRVLDQQLANHPEAKTALDGVDLGPVLAHAGTLMADAPRTGAQLRATLAERFPEHDAKALTHACRALLALVQVPPRGLWGRSGQVTSTTAQVWLGRPLTVDPSIDDVVLRYVAAFGPAMPADVSAWSGLPGMREVLDRLRPRLRTFTDERGRELFDLPDAPRPDEDVPAPVRFLPQYDNVLLSHADRSRFLDDRNPMLPGVGPVPVRGTVLHDGVLYGTWRIERDRATGVATLHVDHVARRARRAADAVSAEGRRYLRFAAEDAAGHDVRVARPD